MARKGSKDRGVTFKEGVWWVRVYANGREKWFRSDTKSQAKVLYGRLKAEQREGRYFPKQINEARELTLKAWITRCLAGSINRDRQHEEQRAVYWSDLWGHRLLSELTGEDLRGHQARMRHTPEEGESRESRKWAPATINRYFSSLRRILTLAVQEGKLSRHPMKGVKFLPEPQTDRFFSDDELLRLKAVMSAVEWQHVALAIETCLRASEQFHARWEHVSFEGKTLTVPLPKGNRTRRIPLSEEACRILRSLQSFLDSPWLYPDPSDPLRPKNPYEAGKGLARRLRQAGISGASWHTLRHTGASRRLLAGVDLVAVSKILGHSTIQTTMRYLHLAKNHLSEAVNRGSVADLGATRPLESEPGVKPGVTPLRTGAK